MKDQPDIEWKDLQPESAGTAAGRVPHPDTGGSWDDQPIPQVQLADLDARALADFRQRAAISQRLSGSAEEGDAALVEQLQLFHLKRAAVLLFHAEPEKLVSGAYIRIGHFRRDHGLVEQHAVGGNLFAQLDNTLALLEEHLQRAPGGAGEPRAPADYPLPLAALREALVNAIVHKDYASGIPIQIRLHDERISLWNPARLPEGWNVASLRSRHLSRPGNPDIANAFYRAGLIEAWGLGIDKLIDACRAHGIVEPLLRHEQGGLWLEFAFTRALPRHFARTAAAKGAGGPAGEARNAVKSEVAGHVAGDATGHVASEVAGYVASQETSHVAGYVAGEVRRLVQACDGVMSRKALQDALGLKSDANFRTLYLVPTLEAGLIEMTIPDKPKSSRQQYRLSSAGASLRQRLNADA